MMNQEYERGIAARDMLRWTNDEKGERTLTHDEVRDQVWLNGVWRLVKREDYMGYSADTYECVICGVQRVNGIGDCLCSRDT